MEQKDLIEEVQPANVVESKVNSANPDVTKILDEEVVQEEVIENTEINDDDFSVDSFEEKPDKPAADVKQVEQKKDDTKEHVRDDNKNTVVARLFKPDIVMKTWNIVGGRVGKMINPKNPDCIKFDAEDTEDIGILLKETAKEEDWSAFPTKWILLVVVGLIIVGKIIMWNKPQQPKQVAQENKSAEIPAHYEKMINQMSDTMNELKEQNKLLRGLLDKKVEREEKQHRVPVELVPPKQKYKGYDLEKISFSENGALIDPDKAGQQGYTEDGKKVGFVSNEVKDIHAQWKIYHKYKEEHLEAA